MSSSWHLDAATPHNSYLSLTSLPWHPPPASSAAADTDTASAPDDQQPPPPSLVPLRISESFARWFWKGVAYGPFGVFPSLVSREGWWPGLLPDGAFPAFSSGGGGVGSGSGSGSSGIGSPPPRSASFSAASASAFAAGFGGAPSPPPSLSPRQYGSWAGAVSGALLHSLVAFEAAFLAYLFLEGTTTTAASAGTAAAASLDMFLLAAMAAHGTGYPLLAALLVCLRGQARPLDPGPPHGVWRSAGGGAAAGPPAGSAVDTAEAAAAQRDVARLTRRYAAAAAAAAAAPLAALGCGVCGRAPVLPAAALGAWPLLSLAAFAAVRAACFAHVDAALRRRNRSGALLRGNVAWVARRAAVPCTLFGTLWLVRRCPGVEEMVAAEAGSGKGGLWWEARFGCCDPLFRRLAKVVLHAAVVVKRGRSRRRGPVFAALHTTRGGEEVEVEVDETPRVQRLPRELALCVLGYLASPDVLTEEHLVRARVIDGSAMIG